MDTGEGNFVETKTAKELLQMKREYHNHGGTFRRGEVVELKGSRFKVKSVKPLELRLRLLKW